MLLLILFVISVTVTTREYKSIPSLKYSMQYNNKKKLKSLLDFINEGKKITWKDGLQAIFTLIKYRFKD